MTENDPEFLAKLAAASDLIAWKWERFGPGSPMGVPLEKVSAGSENAQRDIASLIDAWGAATPMWSEIVRDTRATLDKLWAAKGGPPSCSRAGRPQDSPRRSPFGGFPTTLPGKTSSTIPRWICGPCRE